MCAIPMKTRANVKSRIPMELARRCAIPPSHMRTDWIIGSIMTRYREATMVETVAITRERGHLDTFFIDPLKRMKLHV